MPQNKTASLWSAVVEAGNLSSRTLVGRDTKATWAELVHGSLLDCPIEELRGKCVLLATIDQFRAAATLIQIDGIARRIVLYPPDVPLENLSYVARTAEADVIVTDQPEIEPNTYGVSRVVRCGGSITPLTQERDDAFETEWILLTSGTTGLPKLAMHTLASLAGSAWHTDPAAASMVWSTFYDMRRYGGLHIFLHAALTGTSLVVSSAQESVADFLARAAAHGVTHISGTPSHWRRALMSPAANRIDPEYIRMSGEIVDQAILNQVQAKFPRAKVAHTFASTEAGVGFNVNDGLMGFPRQILESNPLIDMKVQDGTLRIRSKRTATRYLGAESPILADTDGFVDTGDTLELRDGRYYFTGRRDGVINVGGLKVHPEEVESVINRHPHVRMSLVRQRKNPLTGALVVADVVLEPSPDSAAQGVENEIFELCRQALPRHKVPTSIKFVDELAVAATGKIVRRHA